MWTGPSPLELRNFKEKSPCPPVCCITPLQRQAYGFRDPGSRQPGSADQPPPRFHAHSPRAFVQPRLTIAATATHASPEVSRVTTAYSRAGEACLAPTRSPQRTRRICSVPEGRGFFWIVLSMTLLLPDPSDRPHDDVARYIARYIARYVRCDPPTVRNFRSHRHLQLPRSAAARERTFECATFVTFPQSPTIPAGIASNHQRTFSLHAPAPARPASI